MLKNTRQENGLIVYNRVKCTSYNMIRKRRDSPMLETMKKRLKNQRGLTLVELLAVVVILGIISAIAVPSIGGIIEKTRDDAVVAEAIQIVNAAKLYVASEDPGTATLTTTELGDFLDNVDDPDYQVTTTKAADTGKYTYSIELHGSIPIVDGNQTEAEGSVTETELLDY